MKIPAYALFLFFLLMAALANAPRPAESRAAEWQSQTMIKPGEGAMPLLPFLDYYIDISRSMDVEELSAPNLAGEFKPLVLNKLPRMEGSCWLRFTIAPLPPEARPGTFLLDMGQSFPGVPLLFDPERNELSGALEWQEKSPSRRNIMLLPEEGPQATTCYIKIDGLPGPWFAPMIRTPQNAASNLSSLSRNAAILALAVVMVICLLRGLGERGQWRIWTALFVAVALAQAILGMPALSEKFSLSSLAAVLLPGIALMLLPHVGRHLMQTPANSKSIDVQLFLLSLPGAALALLPLIPGWSWLDRWVDLWPICTLIFVPTAIGAWIMGLGGSRRFLTACLIPPIFTGFALAGLDFGFPANILSSLPIWGVGLCALIIAATRSPLLPRESTRKSAGKSGPAQENPYAQNEIISLDHPLDDPNLRLLPTRAESAPQVPKAPEAKPAQSVPEDPAGAKTLEERENALRAPLDEILREAAALGQCSLPPAVRQYAENIISGANMMADIISGEKKLPGTVSGKQKAPQDISFSLQRVLRNVHDSVASFAESSGTALSWYIPPNLGRLYHGNEEELEKTLHLLLESSVRASKNGSVHLSARRVPGSDDPGHILFSITDNGTGVPPKDRSSLAISRAWELTGRHGGYLAMEAGPNGVDIALSLRFPVEGEEEQRSKAGNHIILASDNTARRRELAQALGELPCRISQLETSQEVLVCQSTDPAGLLIAHGQMARPSAADTIHKFASLAREAGFAKSFILAITEDDREWHLLKLSGFTHAMQEPEDLETLKDTISALLRALRESQSPPVDAGGAWKEEQTQLQPCEGAEQGVIPLEKAPPGAEAQPGPDGERQMAPNAESRHSQASPPEAGLTPFMGEEESSAFEGPDWIKPAQEEKPAPDKNDSPLFIPFASERRQTSQNEADPAEGAGGKDEGAQADPAAAGTPENLPDDDGAQLPYNSIMEYVIGEEDVGDSPAGASVGGESISAAAEPESGTSAKDGRGDKETEGDPVVQALIRELDDAMSSATSAYEGHDSQGVAEATGRIIKESENVGLRLLARMATCVERAARENDMNALSDLLPELALAVERNRLALNQNRRDGKQG